MNDNLTAALIAAALLLTGTAAGICLSSVADGATTVTVTPSPVTVTAPPRTVTITRTVEATRASRSRQREGIDAYQAYARASVPASEWPCLRTLWTRESNWRPTARNGSHYGIAQRKGETNTDYRRQIVLGLSYIDARYDGPCDALNHSYSEGWY